MTMALELTEDELAALREVDAGLVICTRGTFKKLQAGSPDVSLLVQRLRAMKLVRLADVTDRSKIPPSRRCEPTEQGKQMLAQHQS
jgi:DNA-binding HxlR family transcriptional regulator